MNELYNNIDSMLAERKYEEAIELLENILVDDPTDLQALSRIGIAFTENGENVKAFKALNYYIKLDNRNSSVYEALGCAYYRTEEFQNAKDNFLIAMNLEPKSPSILRNLGVVCLQMNDFNEGYSLLKESAELNPYDYKTMYALSSALISNGEYDEAKKILNNLLEQNIPEDYELLVKASIYKINNYV